MRATKFASLPARAATKNNTLNFSFPTNSRYFASAATASSASNAEPSKCPVTGGARDYWHKSFIQLNENKSKTLESVDNDIAAAKSSSSSSSANNINYAANVSENARPFSEIPGPITFPILGSIPHFVYSKGPDLGLHIWFRQLYEKYGQETSLVKIALTEKNEVICYDPNLFLQIFMAEGHSPSGVGDQIWPINEYFKKRNRSWNVDLLGGGDPWREARGQINKDLFDPRIVDTYVPSINAAAKHASERLGHICNVENKGKVSKSTGKEKPYLLFYEFSGYAAFDMFSAFLVEKQTRTVNFGLPEKDNPPDPRDLDFVENVLKAFETMGQLVKSPRFMNSAKVKLHDDCFDAALGRSDELSREAIVRAKERLEKNEDLSESSCFIDRILARGEMTEKQIVEASGSFLLAAVDTTANTMNWINKLLSKSGPNNLYYGFYCKCIFYMGKLTINEFISGPDLFDGLLIMVHLANNPDCQAQLFEEVSSVLKGGDYSKDKQGQMPYLRACIREAHRLTPGGAGLQRRVQVDTVLSLILTLLFMDEDLMGGGDFRDFVPERFLPKEVKSRKKTYKSVLDNKIIQKPFSFGPRMCAGARVAEAEIWSFVCRVIQDWKFSLKNVPAKSKHGEAWRAKEVLFTRADPFPEFVFERR